jgi:hypothetical protein
MLPACIVAIRLRIDYPFLKYVGTGILLTASAGSHPHNGQKQQDGQ